jgi:hypothetical protein
MSSRSRGSRSLVNVTGAGARRGCSRSGNRDAFSSHLPWDFQPDRITGFHMEIVADDADHKV